ncbi:stress response protein NST1-like, partial [Actinia tenebrosa]|uniref:Stress response protein NST1-like n=1 Tax=Actinia tenebrosa TaxID=6105 RepID=A0A6P8HYL3_ACTTE
MKVGSLAETSAQFIRESHKAVHDLDYIHSMCGGDLIFLPPGYNEACYHAINLARPFLAIVTTGMGGEFERLCRSLNIISKDASMAKQNFPLLFYAKAGTVDGEEILSRYTSSGHCHGLDVFLCVPDQSEDLSLVIHEYGADFNGILNAIANCSTTLDNYRALRNQQSQHRGNVIQVDSEEEVGDSEVQFGGLVSPSSTGDESTLIEENDTPQTREGRMEKEDKEKRKMEERKKREREEREKREREEMEKIEREEREMREREEREKIEREEREKREREEREKRERDEREKIEREEREKRKREEREKRERDEREKREREEREKIEREEREKREKEEREKREREEREKREREEMEKIEREEREMREREEREKIEREEREKREREEREKRERDEREK